ncbi:MAG: hypothetical protein EPN72_03140 [Nevskiaceae bacterium]|nr:MAG: hypothetical protein EPN63_13515 [Nevskiaceae bacterium]TBR74300.1 MAG: hypothetical protein EPN72_03140 [Nevskiaceae bacterium]
MGSVALLAAAGGLAACATVGNALGIGDGPVLVEQVAAAKDCRGPQTQDTVIVLPTAAEVGKLQLDRNFRLTFPGALPGGPFALVEAAGQADGVNGLAVSRQAQVDHGVLYLTASYFASAAPKAAKPCVLVALPPGRYQQVVVLDPTRARRAAAPVRGRTAR